MAEVTLGRVTKQFGPVTAVHEFNLHIKDAEFVVFVGPSGCGKSTTLRMLAGLEVIAGLGAIAGMLLLVLAGGLGWFVLARLAGIFPPELFSLMPSRSERQV